MTVRASEIGSEGKALIEDQKKGSRGYSPVKGPVREGKAKGQISIGPVTVHG